MGLLGDSFEGVRLIGDKVFHKSGTWPVKGAVARVETGADAGKRITATRLLAIGVFALAAKKTTGSVYLTIEGDGFDIALEVPAKKEADARKFASKINAAGKK